MSEGSKITLLQMQKYFEGQMRKIRIISDLELSENDYRSLGAKLKALRFFTGSESDIEDYMLSIVVYCTYTLIHGDETDNFDDIMWMILDNSQYKERMHLEMYRDVFFSYGLDTFSDYMHDSVDLKLQCQMLTARHAGIPNSEKFEVFEMISDNLDCEDIFERYYDMYYTLPSRSKFIIGLFEDDMHEVILVSMRDLIRDVMDGIVHRDELIAKYPRLSISIIDHCIMWNDINRHNIRFGLVGRGVS